MGLLRFLLAMFQILKAIFTIITIVNMKQMTELNCKTIPGVVESRGDYFQILITSLAWKSF